MKRITSWLVLMLFVASTAVYSQANQQLSKKELLKLETMRVNEAVPGSVPGEIQYTDDPFDLQFEYPCADASGEAGIETDGSYLYTTKWNGDLFFRYGMDGTYIESFQVPGAASVRDLAYDGTYFYGAAASTSLFEMDFDAQTLISTISAAVATRACAYDDGADGFWGNNWSDTPTLYDRTGAVLGTFPINGDESFYGFAWMDNGEGTGLWGYSQKTGTSQNMLYLYDVATGDLLNEFDMLSILTIPVTGDIGGGLFMHPDVVSGTWTLGGIVQNKCLWGVEMGVTDVFPNDVGVSAIAEPVSGVDLTASEPIVIVVKNYGTETQSNIPWEVTWDGGSESGTTGTLAHGDTEEITLSATADLSAYGEYTFEACTDLVGDQVPDNDCKSKVVTNSPPAYCDASTNLEDEFIANVLCGDIDNASGWQGGVADYTDLFATIEAGASEAIVVTNGNAWSSDIVYVWVDWNNNYEFEVSEEFQLTSVGGTGETFEGDIVVPVGTVEGEKRMRVRMTYSTPPVPCGNATYGEVEDYTIMVGAITGPVIVVDPTSVTETLAPDQTSTQYVTISNVGTEDLTFDITSGGDDWLVVSPVSGTVAPGGSEQIALDFNSAGLEAGDYLTDLTIDNNSPTTPVMVDVTLTVEDIGTFDPPYNLVGEYVAPDNALLTWEYDTGEWIGYDDGTNNDGIGLTSGGNFMVSIRWDAADLTPWAGQYITMVKFFPRSELGCDFTLKAWTGANAANLILDQPLTGLVQNEWNEITLDTPILIDDSDELWIGYAIDNQLAGDHPAGVDAGPAVAGYGDMITLDGVTWDSMSIAYGLDFNWNLKALVAPTTDATVFAEALGYNTTFENTDTGIALGKLGMATNPTTTSVRGFVEFNVYKDGEFLASTDELTYTDAGLAPGTYEYDVTAQYDEGESEGAGEVSVNIPDSSDVWETFEDYTAGDYMVQQANAMGRDYWTTWSGAPGTAEDPMVTNAVSFAGANALTIEGTNDAVLLLGDKTEGVWDVSFNIYIPTGTIGYFNLLQKFDGAASEWGMQAYFDVDGAGLVDAGAAGAGVFTYAYDTWIFVNLEVDLTNDFAEMFVDGVSIVTWQWSTGSFGTGTLNQLGAMNLYAWAENGTPGAIFDDIDFVEDGPPPVDPIIEIDPMSLAETHSNPPQVTTKQLTITNVGAGTLTFDAVVYTDNPAPDVAVVDPEAYDRLLARMEADGIVGHSLGMAPNGSSVPSTYSPEILKGAFRGEVAYGDDVEGNNFYSFDVDDPSAVTVIGAVTYAAFCGDFAPGDVDNMYIIDYNDDVLKMVDITTGEATVIASVPCPMAGSGGIWTELAIDKTDGTFYATATDINASNLYIIDPDTGDITLVGDMGIAAVISCTIDLSGTMYAFDIISDNTFTVDLSTGAGTLLGAAGFDGNYAQGMGYDAVNDIVYLAAYSSFAELRVLDVNTGATTALGALPGETGAFGFPYMGGPLPANDVGVSSIVEPVSGPDLTSSEAIVIKIKNFGTASQSNIPWDVTWDGGSESGTLAGPLASGATEEITLTATADLSVYGDYGFDACTYLAGDENPGNDCKSKTVTNYAPSYCDASTNVEDEWIAHVLCGDIDNASGWQGGVADYTDLSTVIEAGMSEAITVENGNAWASDIVYAWVDWNDNYEFEVSEEFQLTNVGGAGQTFEGAITVPVGTVDGEHRMRVRMTYSTAPVPCGDASYGEVEDYTIISGGYVPGSWLTADPLSGSLNANESITIDVTFDSDGLADGDYTGGIEFTSNDPDNPVVDVPVSLHVGGGLGPVINVDPVSVMQNVAVGGTAQSLLDIENTGDEDLTFDITIDFPVDQGGPVAVDPEAYDRLLERMRADGLVGDMSSELAPGTFAGDIQYTDDPFDLQFEYPCADASGEAGIETDGSYLYTTKWNGDLFFRYGMDGTYVESFTVPGAASVRDLAYDGTYFYGAAASTSLFEMDFDSQTLISTISAAVATRACAYDDGEDGFWANNWSDTPTLYDRSGAVLGSFNIGGDESFYGFAWMDNSEGTGLWGYSQKVGTSQNMLYLYDVSSGTILNEFDMLSILTIPATGDIAGGLFMHPDIVSGTWTLGGLVQNVCLWGIDMGVTVLYTNDVGVSSISQPVSGPDLTSSEPIVIVVKNFGTASQSGIPWEVTWDGGSESGTTGTLAGGATEEITLTATADLSAYGEYVFDACTDLAGDENPDNDCKSKTVTNYAPSYCDASTNTEDEWIMDVVCGDINNLGTGWQGGVADYTDQFTTIDAGASEAITVENGNAWASDIVYVWVDWNDNYEFEVSEEFQLTNVGGAGQTFEGFITAPANAVDGEHRMRVRMTYSTPPEPCGNASYGEVEDYTIISGGSTPWLSVLPLSGSLEQGESMEIDVTFNSTGLDTGVYTGGILFTSNDPNNPEVDVPVTLNVGGGGDDPEIAVDPDNFEFTVDINGTDDDVMVIANIGGGSLDYSMTIQYMAAGANMPIERPANFDGSLGEAAPGFVPGEVQYSDDPFDLQFEYACADASGEAGIETDGNYLYTTKWNGDLFFRYGMDGTYIESFTVSGAASVRDLAYDGTYFYGGAASTTVFEMDFDSQTLNGTISAPVATRACAYDSGEDGFWANNWSDSPTLFDRTGSTLNSFNINGDESFYGFAYMNNDEGVALWGNSQAGSGNLLKRYDLPSGTWVEDFDMMGILSLPVTGDIGGGLFMHPNIVPGTWTLGGLVQNVCLWGVEMGAEEGPVEWLSVDPTSGSVLGGGTDDISVMVDADGLAFGTYNAIIKIASNDPDTPMVEVPVTLHVEDGCPLPPPTDLLAELTPPNTVYLTWEEPEIPGGVIRWDDGINNDGIGLTGGGDFYWAAKWDGAQLAEYNGLYLTNVDAFLRGDNAPAFTLMVWTGANAGTVVVEQDLTGLAYNDWNNITLDNPVMIDDSQELWIGFFVVDPIGDFPAGCDAGPAVANYGDMITLDGSSWESMSIAYGLDYNWNIAGIIGLDADGLPLAQPIGMTQTISNPGSDLAQGNLPIVENAEWTESISDYLYFNVYRDGSILADNILVTEYTDLDVPGGDHSYYVSAVYDECEAYSETVWVYGVEINEISTATTSMYPNPATDLVNIESSMNMSRIVIMNNLGQVVYDRVANDKFVQINTASFEKGVYFVQFETSFGKSTEKLIIQ